MLQLILGSAGTGKTTQLHQRIQDCVTAGGKAILIVPEQYSFESEKMLYRRLGAKDALSVEVLSFTRLCDRIFRELGGVAGVHLDDTARYLLMSVALGELGGALRCYHTSSSNVTFVSSICETISELKTAGVTAERLQEIACETADSAFGDKLSDLALILETYQAIVERGYNDPDDNLARACKKLEGRNFFSGYSVFIDGFMAFMGAEWKLLEHIIAGSELVTAALPCEEWNASHGVGVFSAGAKTARRLIESAKRNGRRVAVPMVLRESKRFANPALAWLAQDFPQMRHMAFAGETEGVTVTATDDPYDEMEYIAAQVARLVREEGYRYREIAVIARSLERYLVPLQTVFARYEIPFFTDLREDIQVYPLISGLLCALDAVRGNFDTQQLLALSKTCASGIDCVDAASLENYCYLWGVTGSAWTEPFVNHPDGMVESFTPHQTARLAHLNEIRQKLITPLMLLKQKLSDCDGRGFAEAIFRYLERSDAARLLQAHGEQMEPLAGKQFLDMGAQVWDLLMGLLDTFGSALAGVHLPLTRMIDLLRLSIATADMGSLPQTIDQVIIGTADRIRPNQPKAVFVMGLNEGVFPQWSMSGGILSPAERDRLGAQGVDLLRTPEQYALFEQYFVYFALTQASHRLWLTYPRRDNGGGGLSPSGVIAQVQEILCVPIDDTNSMHPLDWVSNEKTAFDLMTRSWNRNQPDQQALRAYFHRKGDSRLDALRRAGEMRTFSLEEQSHALALFGREMRISPSRAERYYSCPFSYFCQSGLGLYPRKRVEFNPMESGALIHLVLEKMVKKHTGKGLSELSDQQMREEVAAIISADLSAKIQDLANMPARFQYLFGRLVGTLVRLLKRLAVEFAQSDFEPIAFELPISLQGKVKPLTLQTADGTTIMVEGVVDRVDLLHKGDKTYLRVVDYKSGRKSFNLSDVYYGLNMQMLIYLFALCEHPFAGDAPPMPAGVLYMPARDNIIVTDRSATEKEVQEEQIKRLKMNGILLEDREVLGAMEPELAGVFIPVKTKKDGSFSSASSLATLQQMGIIRRQVQKLLLSLAKSLHQGEIDAAPVQGLTGYDPCGWCDYHTICTHEQTDAVRKRTELDKAEVLALMEEEENG